MSIPTTGNPWLDLLIVLAIGFILGWLITGLPPRGRANKAQAQAAELESQVRSKDRELGDLNTKVKSLQSQIVTTEEDLTGARTRYSELESNFQSVNSDLEARTS